MMNGPVHALVNVGGDPHEVATACGKFKWRGSPLDPNRKKLHEVTCVGCIAATADEPIIVEAVHDQTI